MTTASLFTRLDHVVIAARDLAAAEHSYSKVLGLKPSWHGAHPALGTENVIFGLANCYIELLASGPIPPSEAMVATRRSQTSSEAETVLAAIALQTDDVFGAACAMQASGVSAGSVFEVESVAVSGASRRARLLPIAAAQERGVAAFAIAHETADAVPLAAAIGDSCAVVSAVDHVVLCSDDLDGGLHLWRDALAIPEHWRRELPEQGTLNVGLLLGSVTIELVTPIGRAEGERGDRLWGIAYAVEDCNAAVSRLRAAGVAVSDPRPGLAPTTRVATVKWAGHVPTLLIEHTAP